jgi:hypothetical protein
MQTSGASRREIANLYPKLGAPSLRANGSRECAPDDRLREAIHTFLLSLRGAVDCFVAALLAMTALSPRTNAYQILCRHRPRKRAIPYSEAPVMESRSRSVLGTPLSRGMTVCARSDLTAFINPRAIYRTRREC